MEILEFMTLTPLADHPAGKISGGQMKLLELARVLMGDPKVILLDEPAAGVHPTLTGTLIEKIKALNAQSKTFVIIEHDMDFIMRYCNPIIALAEGRVVFEGNAEEAQQSPILRDAYLGATANA
jgi:branched-chain amino acid transport system ATP-binding protein